MHVLAFLLALITPSQTQPVCITAAGSPCLGTNANPLVTMGGGGGGSSNINIVQVAGNAVASGLANGVLPTSTLDTTASGTLGALNARVSIALAGTAGVGMNLPASNLHCQITPQISYDNGVTWTNSLFVSTLGVTALTIASGSSNLQQVFSILAPPGASNASVTCTTYASGTGALTLRATGALSEPFPIPLLTSGSSLVPFNSADGITLSVGGASASGTSPSGNPLFVAGFDSVNNAVRPILVDSSGNTASHSLSLSLGTINSGGHQDFTNQLLGDNGAFCMTVTSASSAGSGGVTFTITQLDSFGTPLGSGVSSIALGAPPATLLGELCSAFLYPNFRISWVLTGAPTYTTVVAEIYASNSAFVAKDPVSLVQFVQGAVPHNTLIGSSVAPSGNPIPIGIQDATGHVQYPQTSDGQGDLNVAGGVATGVSISTVNPLLVSGSDNVSSNRPISVDDTGRVNVNNSFVADTTATGNLNALNTACSIAMNGQAGLSFELNGGTLVGTIVPEISSDGGATWINGNFLDSTETTTYQTATSIVYGSANAVTHRVLVTVPGTSNARVRVSAFTSGAATCNLRATSVAPQAQICIGPSPNGGNVPSNPVPVAGSDGIATRTVLTDSNGAVSVNVLSGASGGGADTTISGSLAALNATIQLPLSGLNSIAAVVTAATLNGTIVPEFSIDGGTTWQLGSWWDPTDITVSNIGSASIFMASLVNPAPPQTLVFSIIGGASHYRIRVSARTSGSVTITMRASMQPSRSSAIQYVAGPAAAGNLFGSFTPVVVGGVQAQQGLIRQASVDNNGAFRVVGGVFNINTDPIQIGGNTSQSNAIVSSVYESNGNLQIVQGDPNPPDNGTTRNNGTGFACTGVITGGAAAQNLASLLGTATQFSRVTRVLVSVAGTSVATGVHLTRITAASGGTTPTVAQHYPPIDAIASTTLRQSPTAITATGGDYSVVFATLGDHEMLQAQGHAGNVIFHANPEGVVVTTDAATTGASFTVCFQWDQGAN